MVKGITPQKADQIRAKRNIGDGTKLRLLRVERGLSQRQLAELSDVPIRTLQKYENEPERIDSTKLSTYCQLCEALDCKISDIIEDENLLKRYNKVK